MRTFYLDAFKVEIKKRFNEAADGGMAEAYAEYLVDNHSNDLPRVQATPPVTTERYQEIIKKHFQEYQAKLGEKMLRYMKYGAGFLGVSMLVGGGAWYFMRSSRPKMRDNLD